MMMGGEGDRPVSRTMADEYQGLAPAVPNAPLVSVAIYAIPGSMAGVVVVCAGPSRAMPSLWAAATYLCTVHRIPGKAGAHRGLPLAVPRLPTAEVRQWSPTRLPEWTNNLENLAGSS